MTGGTRISVTSILAAGLLASVTPVVAHHSAAAAYRRDQACRGSGDRHEDPREEPPFVGVPRISRRQRSEN